MKFTLLTHCKEIDKRSNTGRLVLEVLGDVAEQTLWERLNPPARLVEEIEAGGGGTGLSGYARGGLYRSDRLFAVCFD